MMICAMLPSEKTSLGSARSPYTRRCRATIATSTAATVSVTPKGLQSQAGQPEAKRQQIAHGEDRDPVELEQVPGGSGVAVGHAVRGDEGIFA